MEDHRRTSLIRVRGHRREGLGQPGHRQLVGRAVAHARLDGDPAGFLDAAGRFERIGARFERAATLALVPGRADEGRAELAALEVAGYSMRTLSRSTVPGLM